MLERENKEKIRKYINRSLQLGIEPIYNKDKELYAEFFHRFNRKFNYANSWFYLTQAANGIGCHDYPLGLKYLIDDCLITIGIFKSSFTGQIHFHIINPIGGNIIDHVDDLVNKLYDITNTPVYLKKIEINSYNNLLRDNNYFKIEISDNEPSQFAWHKNAPLEDDTYPELILDIDNTLQLISQNGKNQVKDIINKFWDLNHKNIIQWQDVSDANMKDAIEIVEKFFKYQSKDDKDISNPGDYLNMIKTAPAGIQNKNYLKKIVYINNIPLALICTEQINNSNCHGLYSNICLYQKSKWLSEYVIIETLKILKNQKQKYLNMGGSEKSGLHKFKKKFVPVKEMLSYWLVFQKF